MFETTNQIYIYIWDKSHHFDGEKNPISQPEA